MMLCPMCEGETKVLNTYSEANEVYRIRECKECGLRYYTKEVVDQSGILAFQEKRKKYYRKKKGKETVKAE